MREIIYGVVILFIFTCFVGYLFSEDYLSLMVMMLNQQPQGQGQQTLSQVSSQLMQQPTISQNVNSSVGKISDSHGLSSIGKL